MSDLPPGWEWSTLGEIADIQGGIQKQAKRRPVKSVFPFLRVANVARGSLDLSEVHDIELFDGEIDRWRLRFGDLLVVEGNGSLSQLGRAAMWNEQIPNCVHQNHLIRVRPSPGIDPKYLLYLWNSDLVGRQLAQVGASTSGLHALSVAKLRQVRIPVASSAEQQRIAAAVEVYVSRLDASERFLNSASGHASSFRNQALGELLCGLGPLRPLAGLISEPVRNGFSGRATQDANGVRTLTLTAVTEAEFVDSNTKIADTSGRRIDDLWLKAGDILVQRSNTPDLVGTSALYAGPDRWAIFPDLLIRVRVGPELLPEFAQLVLASPRVRDELRQAAKGLAGSMPKIDQGALLKLLVPVPSISAQRVVVDRAASLAIDLQRVAGAMDAGRRRGKALRRSLLADAFAGRLVLQDPTDERASVLLERIRAERAVAPKPKRARRGQRTDPAQETLS